MLAMLHMVVVRRFEAEKPETIENQLLELLKVCFEKELKDENISDEMLMRTGIRQNGWFVALDEKTNEVRMRANHSRFFDRECVHSAEIQMSWDRRGIVEVDYCRH